MIHGTEQIYCTKEHTMRIDQSTDRFPFLSSCESAGNLQSQSDMEKMIRLSPWHNKSIEIIGGPGVSKLHALEERTVGEDGPYTFVFLKENVQAHFQCQIMQLEEIRPQKSLYHLSLLILFGEDEEFKIEVNYDFRKRIGETL